MLIDIFIANDERGLFFQRVLGPLMVRYGGDLVIRLVWNTAERNSHGDYAEVKINRGATTYPGLANVALPSPGGLGASGAGEGGPGGSGAPGGTGPDDAGGIDDGSDEPLTAEEQDIVDLLTRAKGYWDQYQKLKSRK